MYRIIIEINLKKSASDWLLLREGIARVNWTSQSGTGQQLVHYTHLIFTRM